MICVFGVFIIFEFSFIKSILFNNKNWFDEAKYENDKESKNTNFAYIEHTSTFGFGMCTRSLCLRSRSIKNRRIALCILKWNISMSYFVQLFGTRLHILKTLYYKVKRRYTQASRHLTWILWKNLREGSSHYHVQKSVYLA